MKLEFTSYDDKLGFRVSVQKAESIVIDGKPYEPQEETEWVWDGEHTPSSPNGPMEWDWFGWVCAKCREFPTDDDWDNPEEPPKMEYCPHCGRKVVNKEIKLKQVGIREFVPASVSIEEPHSININYVQENDESFLD